MFSVSIKHGLIGGIILIAVSVLQYIMGAEMLANTPLWVMSFLFPVIWIFIGVSKQRKHFGGIINFKNAFLAGLLIYVVLRGLTTIWGITLFNVIDTEIKYELSEIILDKQIEGMEKWNTPQEVIDNAYDQADEMPKEFSPMGQIKSYLTLILLGIFWSLIAALIFKRKADTE